MVDKEKRNDCYRRLNKEIFPKWFNKLYSPIRLLKLWWQSQYIDWEIIKQLFLATILLFYFHFSLYWLSKNYHLNLYPSNNVEFLLLLTLTTAIYVSWLLGKRNINVLFLAYIITFQIIGLALLFRDFYTLSRLLVPIFLTYLTLFLFKSPAEFLYERKEKQIKNIYEQLKALKKEILNYKKSLESYKNRYSQLKKELENLSSSTESYEELLQEKEELLKKYQNKIEELTKKIGELRNTNAQLWELLEKELEEKPFGISKQKELSRLRRERKKLLKENLKLKEILEELKYENALLHQELDEKIRKINLLEKKNKEISQENEKLKKAFKNVEITPLLEVLLENVNFTPKALQDLVSLDRNRLISVIKTLRKLNNTPLQNHRGKTLTLGEETIFKSRFSGGRIYYKISEGKYEILGILEGEDVKIKDKFIRERLL